MTRVDVRDVSCPLTWVRTRLVLDRVAPGESVEVLLNPGEPLENVPRTAEEEGHRVVSRERWPDGAGEAWRVVLCKGSGTNDTGFLP